jgi:hypothetical protein
MSALKMAEAVVNGRYRKATYRQIQGLRMTRIMMPAVHLHRFQFRT